MTAAITVRLAGEPKGKGRPRFVRKTGHTYTPETTRTYESQLFSAAHYEMVGKQPLDGPLSVRVKAVFAIPAGMAKGKRQLAAAGLIRPVKAPDADNILKTTDALNGVVWLDDKQIVEATISKLYGESPYLEIVVRPWVEPSAEARPA